MALPDRVCGGRLGSLILSGLRDNCATLYSASMARDEGTETAPATGTAKHAISTVETGHAMPPRCRCLSAS